MPLRQSDANEFGIDAQSRSHVFPKAGEMPGFEHQNAVAGRQHIGKGGFPGAGARGGEKENMPAGTENRLDTGKRTLAQSLEFRPAVVDRGAIHRAENAVGDGRRTGDLQEMPPGHSRGVRWHGASICLRFYDFSFPCPALVGKRGGQHNSRHDRDRPPRTGTPVEVGSRRRSTVRTHSAAAAMRRTHRPIR